MSQIVLATASLAFEQRVRRAYGGALNGDLRRWQDARLVADADGALLDLTSDHPAVVVLGPDLPLDEALYLAGLVDREAPEITVLVAAEPSPELWRRALQSGVRDVISPETPDHEVRRIIDRALQRAQRVGPPEPGAAGRAAGAGRVITIIAPKGGAGKTALATNLGVGLAQAKPGSTVLVDFDLQFGDVPTALGLTPSHTIADAARGSGLDLATLKVFLTRHESGLFVLAAPDSPADGEEVAESRARRVIDLLAGEFEFVIVDTSAGLTEHALGALELSTDLLLVCDMAVASAKAMRKVVDALDHLGMTEATRHLILNRADSDVGIDPSVVETMVGMRVDVELPSTRSMPLSMNQGTALLTAAPRSEASRRLLEVVGRFTEVTAPRSGGLFNLRRG